MLGLPLIVLGFPPDSLRSYHQVFDLAISHQLFELRIQKLFSLRLSHITLQPGDQKERHDKVPERKMDLLLGGVGRFRSAISGSSLQSIHDLFQRVEFFIGLLCHLSLLFWLQRDC